MNINLNLYKYFYEVAYYGSYSKASQVLLISQPSLSYSVKVLEKELNKKLFIRNNKGIVLTKYGKKLYDELAIIFNQFQSFFNSENSVKGKVVLGVRSAFAYKILPYYINEIAKIYPDLQIDFFIINYNNSKELLNNEEIDIIIDENDYGEDFVCIETNSFYENVIFAYKNNPIINKKISTNYLKENTICIVERNRIFKEMKKEYPDFKYEKVRSTSIMLEKVKRENVLGISSLAIIKDDIDSGYLVKLNTDIEVPKLKLYIIRKKNVKDKNIETVIDFFKTHFGSYSDNSDK